MGSDRVSEIGAGAGERVGRMGQVLHPSLWRWRLVSTMSGRKLEGCLKVTEGGLVSKSWVEESEERMWKPFLRICLRR